MGRQGRRLDREAFLNAAFRILAEKGFHDLTVEALCAELGVTRGSFYHHFTGMPEFVDSLLAAWEYTLHEVLRSFAAMGTLEATEGIYSAMSRWPVRAESALRAWAWSDPAVAACVRRWDLAWSAASQDWLARLVDDPHRCRLLAHLSQSVIVGMMALQRPVDRELFMAVYTELWRSLVGVEFVPDVGSGRLIPHVRPRPDRPDAFPVFAIPAALPVAPEPTTAARGGRLDRQAYFNAAFRILAASGFQDLTVEVLCAELGVTRGSFYHHFTGLPDFVEGLLQTWEASVGGLLDRWVTMPPMEAVVDVAAIMNRYPFQAEAALRAWGWSNPMVAASVRRWDLARQTASGAWLENVIPDPERRRVILHMSQALFVGMQILQRPFDIALYMTVTAEFARCTIGLDIVVDENGTFVPRASYLNPP